MDVNTVTLPLPVQVVGSNQLCPILSTQATPQALQQQPYLPSHTLPSELDVAGPRITPINTNSYARFPQSLRNHVTDQAFPWIPNRTGQVLFRPSQANVEQALPLQQQLNGSQTKSFPKQQRGPRAENRDAVILDAPQVAALPQRQSNGASEARFGGLKTIPDPPNLQEWREKLFNVEDVVTLTEDEFKTYFPHVDNVYSHRSTQNYKRNPFIAHYYDCRLKGRPAGTKKSEDPNKKKRKRTARERNQCDVKIKIVEFIPSVTTETKSGWAMPHSEAPANPEAPQFFTSDQVSDPAVVAVTPGHPALVVSSMSSGGASITDAIAGGKRIYTIQRVNGNGGNGKSDRIVGMHKHTLGYSDQTKKNSIERSILKDRKESKKFENGQKTYHKKASGNALITVKKHSKEHELKLYGSCFCPFVQRVWISLELKQVPYQYIEVDPYKKPQSLLDVNPRGLIPALRHGKWSCHESTVLMEYLEEINQGTPLLPNEPQPRAHSRLWADHVNRHIIPSFYHLLQAQETSKQLSNATALQKSLDTLIAAAHPTGPFFLGPTISFVDVHFAPWMVRMSRVLKPYRSWPDAEPRSRWAKWLDAVEGNEAVKATMSEDVLYLESYERYAENRPGTSELARAVNEGRGLP